MSKAIIPRDVETWLYTRGDRSPVDLCLDGKGFYVMMSEKKGKMIRVYLPSNLKFGLADKYR